MNKINKFRVWDNTENIFLHNKGFTSIGFNTDGDFFPYGTGYSDKHWEGRFIVQQYTGLKDRQGKEIFEGDIVKAKYEHLDFRYKNNAVMKPHTGEIRYHHSYWAIGDMKLFVMEDDSLEVIGNIFENPELLVDKQ